MPLFGWRLPWEADPNPINWQPIDLAPTNTPQQNQAERRGESFRCPICGQEFSTAYELNQHTQKHNEDRERQQNIEAERKRQETEAAQAASYRQQQEAATAAQAAQDTRRLAEQDANLRASEQVKIAQQGQTFQGLTVPQAEPTTGEQLGGWNNWYSPEYRGGYSMPRTPQRNVNPFDRPLQGIYEQFGIPFETFYGKAVAGARAEGMTAPPLLGEEAFKHNIPLAIWMPDGTVYKANNPDEFKALVTIAQQNEKYLYGDQNRATYSNTPLEIKSFQEMQDDIKREKSFDTPERQQLQYWELQQRRLGEYEANVAQVEQILDNLPEGVTAANLRGTPAAIIDRVKWQTGRYNQFTAEEIQANVDEALEAQAKSLDKLMGTGIDAVVEDGRIVYQAANEWTFISLDEFKKGDKTYTAVEITTNPELQKQFNESISPKELSELSGWVEANPKQFASMVVKAGDNPVTRAIVPAVFPKASEEEVNTFFSTIQGMVGATPSNFNPFGQALKATGITPGEIGKSLVSGTGSLITSIGGASEYLTKKYPQAVFEGMSQSQIDAQKKMDVRGFGNKVQEKYRVQRESFDILTEFDERGPAALVDQRFWRDIALQTVETVPTSIALMGASVLAAYAAPAVGAGLIGTLGTAAISGLLGGAVNAALESVMEAGGGYDEAKNRGYTDEQAEKVFEEIFINNMKLLAPSDWLQYAVAFIPGGKVAGKLPITKLMVSLAEKGIVKVGMVGGKLTVTGLMEGGQEYIQNVIQKKAMGDSTELTSEDIYAVMIGFAMGVGLGGAGDVFSSMKEKTKRKMDPGDRADFDRYVETLIGQGVPIEDAELIALDEYTNTIKGQIAVSEVIDETKLEEIQKESDMVDMAFAITEANEAVDNIEEGEGAQEKTDKVIKKIAKKRGVDEANKVAAPPEEGVTPVAGAEVPVAGTTGKERLSRWQERANKELDGILGDNPAYAQMNIENQKQKANAFVESNPEDAALITQGLMQPPGDLLKQSISVAYFHKMLAEGNTEAYTEAANAVTLRGTRYGQEIVSLRGEVNNNSPLHFIEQVINNRVAQAGRTHKPRQSQKTAAANVAQKIKEGVAEIKEISEAKTLDIIAAQKLIDKLTC